MSHLMPHFTDEQIAMKLWEYDEQGYSDIPSWLRHQIEIRNIQFPTREPTPQEKAITVQDAREHRLMNNERTMEDFKHKYTRKR